MSYQALSWSEQLFKRCEHAEVEIHSSGVELRGSVDSIERVVSGSLNRLVVRIRDGEGKIIEKVLDGCGEPLELEEDEWDCVWATFPNGRIIVRLSRPH